MPLVEAELSEISQEQNPHQALARPPLPASDDSHLAVAKVRDDDDNAYDPFLEISYRDETLALANISIYANKPFANNHIIEKILNPGRVIPAAALEKARRLIAHGHPALPVDRAYENPIVLDMATRVERAVRQLHTGEKMQTARWRTWKKATATEVPASGYNSDRDLVHSADFSIDKIPTPVPDLTVGLAKSYIKASLKQTDQAAPAMDDSRAEDFLHMISSRDLGPPVGKPCTPSGNEPLLRIFPCATTDRVGFPFLLLQSGKYGSDATLYKMQNEGAAASAGALTIQRNLDLLEAEAVKDPLLLQDRLVRMPMVFYVVHEGPVFELWAAYDVWTLGPRMAMGIVGMCHTAFSETIPPFIEKLAAVIHWGTGDFAERVTEQMNRVLARVEDSWPEWRTEMRPDIGSDM